MTTTDIAVHGDTITLYARVDDKNPIDVRIGVAATTIAGDIDIARQECRLSGDMPLVVALLVWAWNGTGELDGDSWLKYRGKMLRIIELSGRTVLADCDHNWYGRLHRELVESQNVTASFLEGLATAFGSFAKWVDTATDYDGARPGGTASKRSLHRTWRAKARDNHGHATKLIKVHHCPGPDDATAFGLTLGDVAAQRWGEEYRCWQDAPLVHMLTGARIAELPVLTVDDFDLTNPKFPTVHIHRQFRDGIHEPGRPCHKPTKNKLPREALLWPYYVGELTRIIDEASKRPGGLLFPIPPSLKTGKRQLQSMYEDAIAAHGYSWTSHAHRSAYISWNLATPEEGGFGRSAAAVARWVGHTDTGLIERTYWVPVAATEPSNHKPGTVPAAVPRLVEASADVRPIGDVA